MCPVVVLDARSEARCRSGHPGLWQLAWSGGCRQQRGGSGQPGPCSGAHVQSSAVLTWGHRELRVPAAAGTVQSSVNQPYFKNLHPGLNSNSASSSQRRVLVLVFFI